MDIEMWKRADRAVVVVDKLLDRIQDMCEGKVSDSDLPETVRATTELIQTLVKIR